MGFWSRKNVSCPNVELQSENVSCSIVENVLPTKSSSQLMFEKQKCCFQSVSRYGFAQSMSSSMLSHSPTFVHSQKIVSNQSFDVENVESKLSRAECHFSLNSLHGQLNQRQGMTSTTTSSGSGVILFFSLT